MKKAVLISLLLSFANYASQEETHYWSPDAPAILACNIGYNNKVARQQINMPNSCHLLYTVQIIFPRKTHVFLTAYKYLMGPEKDQVTSWQSIWRPSNCIETKVDNRLFEQLQQLYKAQEACGKTPKDII